MPQAAPCPTWQVAKVHHLGLTVKDIDGSVRFYRDLLGMRLVGRRQADAAYVGQQIGYAGLRLEVATLEIAAHSDQLLQLAQFVSHPGKEGELPLNRPGKSHLCLEVDDVHAAYRDLRARGYDSNRSWWRLPRDLTREGAVSTGSTRMGSSSNCIKRRTRPAGCSNHARARVHLRRSNRQSSAGVRF